MTTAVRDAGRLVGGRYALEALIGRGGMGEVWRARHVALRSPVAIKLLHGAAAPSERARRRFLTEAQVTANLRSRHAVQVFDFGVSDDGRPFLVMELLEGETLDRRIARAGRLPVAVTSRTLQKAARALERAHALGIVHRDFKPENIMLVADEEEGGELVKVVDFGIAKLVGDLDATLKGALGQLARARRSDSPPSAVRPPLLEVESGGVGTPYYMAPEQVQDLAEVGPAADIWAFGVVAYECLTGRRPYDDASIGRLLVRVAAAAPPPPASSIAQVPASFDDWFRKACAARPGDRFADVQTASAALAVALDTAVLPGPAPREIAGVASREITGAAPTLSSRKECAEAAAGQPRPIAECEVSPLAATLAPLPALPAPPVPARVPLPPRSLRLVPALSALLIAALAIAVAVHDQPVGRHPPVAIAHAVAQAPAPVPTLVDLLGSPPSAPVEPAVVSSALPPEPAAVPSVTPARPRPRRRQPEATPSVYHLPPLGL